MKKLNLFDAAGWLSMTCTSVMPFMYNVLAFGGPECISKGEEVANVFGIITVSILLASFGVFNFHLAEEKRKFAQNKG